MSLGISHTMSRPYVGIVGIKSLEEMQTMSLFGRRMAIFSGAHLQIGVQVSPKVIDMRDRGNNLRLPSSLSEVRSIFEESTKEIPNVFNVVHYSDKEKYRLRERMDEIFGYTRIFEEGLCQGIQLNGYLGHINLGDLYYMNKKYPGLKVIIQIGAIDIGDCSKEQFGRIKHRLYQIERYVGYVLIDCSGGEGKPIDIKNSVRLALEICYALPRIAIGFAGGLCGDNVGFIVRRIAQKFGSDNFSIDSESGNRDKVGDGYGNDTFNPQKARNFSEEALYAFDCLRRK